MEMKIDFPGGARVNARFGNHAVATDQPPAMGGEGTAPTPFELFLASLGTCAGIYVLWFCRKRNLPTDGLHLVQQTETDDAGHVVKLSITIQLPPDFPEKYKPAVIRAAEQCKVKAHLEKPPIVEVTTEILEPIA